MNLMVTLVYGIALAAPFPPEMRDDITNYCVKQGEVVEFCTCVTDRLQQSTSSKEVEDAITALKAGRSPKPETEQKYKQALDECKRVN